MLITNKHNLPSVLVRAMQRDPYTRGESRFSVTQLIDAPRPRIIKAQHPEEVARDISDSVWMLLGKGVHHILEMGAAGDGDPDRVVEERLFATVAGIVVSGAMDVQEHADGGDEILDYKVTSTFRATSPDGQKKWEEQLNCYADLRRRAKQRDTKRLTIIAFFRDWSKSKARQNPDYPQLPVMSFPQPVWPAEAARSYLDGRVRTHLSADQMSEFTDPPLCTDEERWKRAGTFEVVQMTKDGREWVRQVFEGDGAKAKAEEQMADNISKFSPKWQPETFVREREAVPIRCMDWCEAAPFCSQWQAEQAK